eukprot:5296312-Pleurochrysis_carterae.AAC.2
MEIGQCLKANAHEKSRTSGKSTGIRRSEHTRGAEISRDEPRCAPEERIDQRRARRREARAVDAAHIT